MTDTNTAATAALTPERAMEQRSALMADATWRAGAMDSNGPQWKQLRELDSVIAAAHEATDVADDAAQSQPSTENKVPEEVDDDPDDTNRALEFFNRVPETPGGYELATDAARQKGLQVDGQAEIELRQALHKAEVPNHLAQVMYFAAVTAATQPESLSPVAQETQYRQTAHALHKKWGSSYEANLAVANAEAQRIFDAMPASITHELSFAEWCQQSGIANNRVVVEALFARANQRSKHA